MKRIARVKKYKAQSIKKTVAIHRFSSSYIAVFIFEVDIVVDLRPGIISLNRRITQVM